MNSQSNVTTPEQAISRPRLTGRCERTTRWGSPYPLSSQNVGAALRAELTGVPPLPQERVPVTPDMAAALARVNALTAEVTHLWALVDALAAERDHLAGRLTGE